MTHRCFNNSCRFSSLIATVKQLHGAQCTSLLGLDLERKSILVKNNDFFWPQLQTQTSARLTGVFYSTKPNHSSYNFGQNWVPTKIELLNIWFYLLTICVSSVLLYFRQKKLCKNCSNYTVQPKTKVNHSYCTLIWFPQIQLQLLWSVTAIQTVFCKSCSWQSKEGNLLTLHWELLLTSSVYYQLSPS